jgi:hypothetical protein
MSIGPTVRYLSEALRYGLMKPRLDFILPSVLPPEHYEIRPVQISQSSW